MNKKLVVSQPRRVRLADIDPADTDGLDKEQGLRRIEALGERFGALEDLLAYAGTHALLVVVQGRDAAGKDGLARRILNHSNVQTVHVEAFKVPTEEERAHDFLWRVHARAPRLGHLTVFNRSHYEDVLAARVHRLVPEKVWRKRYDAINAFEQLLVDANTIVLKFFLHITKEEQEKRLLEREQDARKFWKLNARDWEERSQWDEMTAAYEEAISRCATPAAPWQIVPADKKWYRDLTVLEAIVKTLERHEAGWMEHLESIGEKALAEVRAARGASARQKRRKRP